MIRAYFIKAALSVKGIMMLSFVLHTQLSIENRDYADFANKYVDMSPVYWAIGIIAGCIGLTLSYVSWKKYRAEKQNKQKDHDQL